MKYITSLISLLFRQKLKIGAALGSALFFFIFFFPFSDLSNAVTSVIAGATGNQVYLQAERIDLHVLPKPAVSAKNLVLETALPRLQAEWAKLTPSVLGSLLNIRTLIKAANGDLEAGRVAPFRMGLSFAAEGILGGEVSVRMSSGSKSEQGRERSRVSLVVEDVNLKDVQEWADLPVSMTGTANLETDLNLVPSFEEQPEGEYEIEIDKFMVPASSIPTPMGPLAAPTLTLAKVTLRGRLVGGNLFIEEGSFGQNKDPLFGRIKGQMALRLQMMGPNIVPQFGPYNLTVELNANAAIQRDLGIAFILLDSVKEAGPQGGARYLFRASGQGMGIEYPPPSITRLSSF